MLLQAIGAMLPAAIAIAISPFPIIGVVLVVTGPHGRVNGPTFAVGWLTGLTALTIVAVAAFDGAAEAGSTTAALAGWGRVVAGAVLVVLGVRSWWRQPATGEADHAPTWMRSLESANPRRAFVLGLGLATVNPKNIVLVLAASASVAETGVDGSESAAAVAVFVLLGSASIVGAVVVRLVGGRWGDRLLDRVRTFMVANSHTITMLILVILGAQILGDGLEALGR